MVEIYEGPKHLSVSQINAIQENSWHWFLERVAKVPRQPAWPLVGGKAYHSLTEFLDHKVLKEDEWITDYDDMRDLWHQFLDSEVKKEVHYTEVETDQWKAAGRASKQWPNKEDGAFWRESGATWGLNYVTWRQNNTAYEIADFGGGPAIELEVGGVFESATLPLVGYIDRVLWSPVTETLTVLDIKSGSHIPTSTFQLGTYSVVLEQMYGVQPRYGAYWGARTGGTSVPADLHADYPVARLEHAMKTTEDTIRNNTLSCNAGGFAPNSSTAQYCYACTGIKDDTILPWEVEVRLPDLSA